MSNVFNQHKESVKAHLLRGYNKALSLDDFYSWADETYSMCEGLVRIMKDNMSNYRNNNEELKRIFEKYWKIREIKGFMREVHPLKIFLESSCDDLSFDSVCPKNGNENHDAILKKGNQEIPVEITGTQDGKFTFYLLLHMYRFGPTPFIGVTTDEFHKALINDIPVESRGGSVSKNIKKEAEKVNKAIRKKWEKDYPDGTLLIVTAFNDQPDLPPIN